MKSQSQTQILKQFLADNPGATQRDFAQFWNS